MVIYEGEQITLGSIDGIQMNWTVLRSENGRALLICNEAVTTRQMEGDSWAKSGLRKWLNDEFYQQYFTDTERSIFIQSEITTPPDSVYDAKSGPATKDVFFVLSGDEARTFYYEKEQRTVRPNRRAMAEGVRTSSSGTCSWWLRSLAAENSSNFMVVGRDGGIGWSESYAQTVGVRPAVWINLYAPALGFLFTP